jgi:hypothetical protein
MFAKHTLNLGVGLIGPKAQTWPSWLGRLKAHQNVFLWKGKVGPSLAVWDKLKVPPETTNLITGLNLVTKLVIWLAAEHELIHVLHASEAKKKTYRKEKKVT